MSHQLERGASELYTCCRVKDSTGQIYVHNIYQTNDKLSQGISCYLYQWFPTGDGQNIGLVDRIFIQPSRRFPHFNFHIPNSAGFQPPSALPWYKTQNVPHNNYIYHKFNVLAKCESGVSIVYYMPTSSRFCGHGDVCWSMACVYAIPEEPDLL